jgi:serine/threonine protein kinase
MMARGVFAQYSKEAQTTLRYRFVCESCEKLSEWYTARMSHKSNRLQKISQISAGSKVLETPEIIAKEQENVNRKLNLAIEKFNTAIIQRTQEVIFPGDPFLAKAYNDIFQHGEACPHCGERQTWYPAVSETKSITKSIRNNATIFAAAGIVIALVVKDNFSYFWSIPLATALLGAGVGLFVADEEMRKKQKFVDNHPTHNNPEIEWNYVQEVDVNADEEIDANISPVEEIPIVEKQISVKTSISNLSIYKQLLSKNNINILSVKEVNDENIVFEDFNGITLAERLKSKLSIHDFEDYLQQICDALEFLHSQKKPISYNNLTADNIVIGEDNLLKLFNFNKADNITPISLDIEAVAKLILTVDEKYIKRYTSITKPCFNGAFKTFDEINTAISKNVRNRLGIRYSLLATGILMLFMFRRVGSRLVPMFEQLFNEIWKMIFGT